MEYSIVMRKHWWFDAGLAGLYSIASIEDERLNGFNIKMKIDNEKQALVFQYNSISELRSYFETCYEILAERYWNVSTIKQKENPELVVYNKMKNELLLLPKRNPTPIVSLFIGARSWQGEGIPYNEIKEPLKSRVDQFLNETKSKLWGSNKLLLFNQPVCHQKLTILPQTNNRKKYDICSVCGQSSQYVNEIGLPSFLLFASSNATKSFNSQGKNPAKICWECEFISKFAVESASYKKDKKSIFIIQISSPDIEKLLEMQKEFGALSSLRLLDDKYYLSNIGHESNSLIKYCSAPYELLWSFMEDKYNLLLKECSENEFDNALLDSFFSSFLEKFTNTPVQFYVLYAEDSGDTFLSKNLIVYNEVGYFYRLIHYLKKIGVNTRIFFHSLYEEDFSYREKVIRNILKKNSILFLIEQICFRKVMTEQFISMKHILNFTIEYEQIIRGDEMNKEQIETAVNLGKQIVIQAVEIAGMGEENEKQALKKIKGDLYQLRKTRNKTDFLNQINNLQFRYGVSVSNRLLEGTLEEVNFEDFRAYCILGALNVYNAKNKDKEDKHNEER